MIYVYVYVYINVQIYRRDRAILRWGAGGSNNVLVPCVFYKVPVFNVGWGGALYTVGISNTHFPE